MRLKLMTATIVLALASSVGIATASVVIYNNPFKSKPTYREVKKFQGKKACRRFFPGKKGFGAEVRKGPLQCDFRTPVTGDAKEPDHEIEVSAKVLDSTAKGARKGAYVGVALRADKSSRYELRVFPDKREWQLRRKPDGGGGDFPAEGTDGEIKKTGKVNKLKLRAFGDKVTAFVNKETVASVTDSNPGELNGRKTMIVAGNTAKKKSSAKMSFGNLRIRIP
jgi:hypothetical protein